MPGVNPRTYFILQSLQATLLDALLPPRCAACGQPGQRWCPACQVAAPRLRLPLCRQCGEPLASRTRATLCEHCRAASPAYHGAVAWGLYGGSLQTAIQKFKFQRDSGLALVFSGLLAEAVQAQAWPLDTVVAVPLGAQRLRQRGYNQAALLARPLAARLGCRYPRRALVRVRETRPQVGLSRPERHQNMAGAFAARPEQVRNRTVLVVDDVMTSGATLDAAARALLAAGARAVYAATLARAA